MEKYTDDDIRKMDKITCKIAADYLGISPNLLTIGMRNDKLPIGFAVRQEDRYRENWTYAIIPERLIAYKHGKINEVQVQGIEHNLETIIKEFTEMKKDGRTPEDMHLWWTDPSCVVLGRRDSGSLEKTIRRLGVSAGVDKCHPHRFRRTGATMALRAGMPIIEVSKLLGHESIATTQIYLDIEDKQLEATHEKYVI